MQCKALQKPPSNSKVIVKCRLPRCKWLLAPAATTALGSVRPNKTNLTARNKQLKL